MTQRKQTLHAIAGVLLIAATVAVAPHARTWADQYRAYFERMNADADVCEIGTPARCIKAREGA